MEVECFYKELLVPVSRNRLFKALVIDGHNLIPKLLPHVIKSIDFIHGNGGPGSIKQTIFSEASGLAGGHQLQRVDILDPTNFVYKLTLIGGGLLFEKMHAVVYEVRYEALGRDKCICRVAAEYHLKEEYVFDEEDIKIGEFLTMGINQAVIQYLVSNPEAYS